MLKYLLPGQLVSGLQYQRIPPRFQLILLAAVLLVQCVLGHPGIIGPLSSSASTPVAILHLVLALVGLFVGYSANAGAAGRNFLERYVVVGSVLYVWIYVGGLMVFEATYIAFWYATGPSATASFQPYGAAQIVFSVTTSTAFLLLLRHYIKRVASVDVP